MINTWAIFPAKREIFAGHFYHSFDISKLAGNYQGAKLLAFQDVQQHCRTKLYDQKPCNYQSLERPKPMQGFPSVFGKPGRAADSQILDVAFWKKPNNFVPWIIGSILAVHIVWQWKRPPPGNFEKLPDMPSGTLSIGHFNQKINCENLKCPIWTSSVLPQILSSDSELQQISCKPYTNPWP